MCVRSLLVIFILALGSSLDLAAQSVHTMLIWSDHGTSRIYQFNLTSPDSVRILFSMDRPEGHHLAADSALDLLFWEDAGVRGGLRMGKRSARQGHVFMPNTSSVRALGKMVVARKSPWVYAFVDSIGAEVEYIFRRSRLGGPEEVVHKLDTSLGSVRMIEFGPSEQVLYIAYQKRGRVQVWAHRIDDMSSRQIILSEASGLDNINDFLILGDYLYFTQHHVNPDLDRIARVRMVPGSPTETVYNGLVSYPREIEYNTIDGRLYWADTNLDWIASCTTEGKDFRVDIRPDWIPGDPPPPSHPTGLEIIHRSRP